jgi:small subunit ribosomal protein S21
VNEKNDEVELGPLEVHVERDNVARAISQLKRMMAREGVLKEVKNRRFYEKPSVKEKRKRCDAERRRRKEARKVREERRRRP